MLVSMELGKMKCFDRHYENFGVFAAPPHFQDWHRSPLDWEDNGEVVRKFAAKELRAAAIKLARGVIVLSEIYCRPNNKLCGIAKGLAGRDYLIDGK